MKNYIKKRCPIKHQKKTPAHLFTSFKQSGILEDLFIIEQTPDLKKLPQDFNTSRILGKGSNILITKKSLGSPWIKLGDDFQKISNNKTTVSAGANCSVQQLLTYCQKQGLTGLEFMAAVPASLGGMIAMNFGCWGNEISDKLKSITIFIPNHGIEHLAPQDCAFAYRSSIFQKKPWIILNAELELNEKNTDAIKQTIATYAMTRCKKQPMRGKTFGSIFKNPPDKTAATLIESLNLKGKTINDAFISHLHANFMENKGQSSAEDAIELIQVVQEKVQKKYMIKLEPEVCIC